MSLWTFDFRAGQFTFKRTVGYLILVSSEEHAKTLFPIPIIFLVRQLDS